MPLTRRFLPGARGIMIARCAIRSGRAASPCWRRDYTRKSTAWEVNAADAPLPPSARGIMIARCAIRSGRAASPCWRRDYTRKSTAWEVNAADAPLPSQRTWYNDCTLCNPKRQGRFALLAQGLYPEIHGLGSKCR